MRKWAAEGRNFALARVVSTWGSAPRRVGSAMAVTAETDMVGSVSGGCIEGSVIEETRSVLQTGRPRLLEYGVDDETAWSVGLSCGGTVKVLVTPFPSIADGSAEPDMGQAILSRLESHRPFVLLSGTTGPRSTHLLVEADGSFVGHWPGKIDMAIEAARSRYRSRTSELMELEGQSVFVHVIPPKDRLLVLGATDIATHLVRLAAAVGIESVVVDPREVFARVERFDPVPERLVVGWPQEVLADLAPDEGTYAVLLTHDPKIDDPALQLLLKSPVPYIGALGSRRTHARRVERLIAAGLDRSAVDRIRGPVGLDIGAATPAEIALSILSEIVAVKNAAGSN